MGADNKRFLIIETVSFFMLTAIFVVFAFLSYNHFNYLWAGLLIFLSLILVLRIFFFITIYKNNNKIIKKEDFYGLITDTIPGGYFDIELGDKLNISHIDKKFLKFTGYTEKEIKEVFNNNLLEIIDEEFRDTVLDAFYNQTRQQSKSQVYYKIKCKDKGSIGVIDMFRIYIDAKENKIAQNLLLEPSSFKQVQMERDLDNMRYKIVAEQSESIIFDYNPNDKHIFLNSHFQRKFGYTINGNLFDYIKKYDIIYQEDLQKFMDLSFEEKDYNEIEIRLKKADGEYIWCKLRITTIMGEDNRPSRLIGKIIDVDRSRREKLKLIEKTRRDLMTGMYNKLTTEALIDEAIDKSHMSLAAFLLIDIDNFKNINDNLGHMQGDNVLTEISEQIKSIFRSTDIIGRIGGDEFVVFIKDLYSESHAIKKAIEILETVRKIEKKKIKNIDVTVSIGIAFHDKDGKDYNELYINADKALYCAKNKGKNTYELYWNMMQKRRETYDAKES